MLVEESSAPFAIQTPALLVDEGRFDANVARLQNHIGAVSEEVRHRPHLKTVKSVELAQRITSALGTDAITVSTLKEAEIFAAAGYTDVLYAVGVTPAKLDRVSALHRAGTSLIVITDNLETAEAIAEHGNSTGIPIPVMIEIDVDGHRAGVHPDDNDKLLAIAAALSHGAELRGVMTHAGGSYSARSAEELQAFAEQERSGTIRAAETLRSAGHACPDVSIGSTPTALNTQDLSGVTEIRAGVYAFFDLVMAELGVCESEEIALSVLTSVIGHQEDKGWILVDAGWMAMSRDLGATASSAHPNYGLVCDAQGTFLPDLIMISANQEHGILALRDGSATSLPHLSVGTQLRILPNHACATAAQHEAYHLVGEDGTSTRPVPRFGGW